MVRRTLLSLIVVSLMAAGCTKDDEPVATGGPVVTVESSDNTFSPERIEITPGTSVRWVNVGRNSHNVLHVEGDAFGVKTSKFGPGREYMFRFDEPGTYSYWCSLHGSRTRGMVGTITVADQSPPATSANGEFRLDNRPATDVPDSVDLAAITVPRR